jgi:Mce-associated membrane protein
LSTPVPPRNHAADVGLEILAEQWADDVPDAEPPSQPAPPRSTRRRWLPLAILLLVAGIALSATGYFRGQIARAGAAAADNQAIVDTTATAEVVAQVSNAIEVVLSYDFSRLDDSERAGREVSTGHYAEQYARTFADVRRHAPEQKLVLTSTVRLAGVTNLRGDRAEVIAAVDHAATKDSTPFTTTGRVKVVATKVDGRWKIAEMTLP